MEKGKRIGIFILTIICFIGLCVFAHDTIQEEKELYKLRNFYTETLQSKVDAEEDSAACKRKVSNLNEKNKQLEATIQDKDKIIADKDAEIQQLKQEITNLKK